MGPVERMVRFPYSGSVHFSVIKDAFSIGTDIDACAFLLSVALTCNGITLSTALSKTKRAQPSFVSWLFMVFFGPYVAVILYGGVPPDT